ncbi:MAG: ATP-binding protein, partial [Catenulispora sp.]
VEPIALGLGLPVRINPLDLGPLGHGWDSLPEDERKTRATTIFARWVVLLKALIGARGVDVTPADENALTTVLAELSGWAGGGGRLRTVTIPEVWHTLSRPSKELADACRYASQQQMIDETRQATDALGALVRGALAGLFDAETTIRLDWNAPIQSLSLKRLEDLGDEVVGVALACVNSWARAQNDLRRPGEITIVVRDEVWRQMRLGVGAVQSLDADLRLSRNDGEIQVVVAHKPSDLLSVGDAGSQEVAIAKDMMALCDTKVMFAQDPTIADELSELVGLGDVARGWVSGWARQRVGRAVWMVGDRVFKVTTVQTPAEKPLFETNTALVAQR